MYLYLPTLACMRATGATVQVARERHRPSACPNEANGETEQQQSCRADRRGKERATQTLCAMGV